MSISLVRASALRVEAMYAWMLMRGLRHLNLGVAPEGAEGGLEAAQRRVYERLFAVVDALAPARDPLEVLEIGAGLGEGFRQARGHWRYRALDRSVVAALAGRARGQRFAAGRMERLPAADESLDVACAAECFCAPPEAVRRAFLAELRRALRPDGVFVTADFFNAPAAAAEAKLAAMAREAGLALVRFEDLTAEAQRSIRAGEPERAAIFAKIPGLIRRTALGRSLHETLALEGSKRLRIWMNGEKVYAVTAFRRAESGAAAV